MSVSWGEYVAYEPVVDGPLGEMSRRDARAEFEHCMETRPERVAGLRRLLGRNGVELGDDVASISALDEWFVENLMPHPDEPGRFAPPWYSVCHDIALFLGDVMIERHPVLGWELFVWGKTTQAYQRHVIMGFTTSDPRRRVNFDLGNTVVGYGEEILAHQGSVPSIGVVQVNGVEVDVDASVAAQLAESSPETDEFVQQIEAADRLA